MFSAPARVWERSPSHRLETRVVQAGRLTTILPAMRPAETLETTRLHRAAGRTGRRTAVVTTRPFRAPHQTMADGGLLGGGQVPMPGEVSPAHSTSLSRDERSEWVPLIHHPHGPAVPADLGSPHA
jgi:predicted ATPase with chaperone activity